MVALRADRDEHGVGDYAFVSEIEDTESCLPYALPSHILERIQVLQ